ncbi:MAG: AraC family transcriptional regulator [Acidovorax sp.]|uniref:helix-turn-helix transcriptional regulator n=1 Tax=Acidovorax sp. TaxID=1872122 RepID=UPI0039E529C9
MAQPPRFQLLACVHPGMDAMQADSAMAFGKHVHTQFGLGVIERGAQRSASGRGMVEAGAGDTITVNPGEVHDGAPLGDGGRAWRMLYLEPALVAGLAADVLPGASTAFEFHAPALRDAQLAAQVRALFAAATAPAAPSADLRVQECLLGILGTLLRPGGRELPAAIAPARTMMDDDPAAPWSLAELAAETGLSRYQLVRQFARATGLTPHAYLLQRRLQQARRLITAGTPLAEAAAASGFADQSHLTRVFTRSFGVTPGAYAQRAAISFKTRA